MEILEQFGQRVDLALELIGINDGRTQTGGPLSAKQPDNGATVTKVKWLYATKRGERPLIGVAVGVCQSVPQWSRSRSR